jgi:hypothetical protein
MVTRNKVSSGGGGFSPVKPFFPRNGGENACPSKDLPGINGALPANRLKRWKR